MARKVVKTSFMDPQHSVDLYDGDRKNEFGTMHCVAPAILPYQVDSFWEVYKQNLKQEKGNVQN
jgi:hypothetical protein